MNSAVWLVIPCAGKGRRFGAATPKQYLPLLDKTVFQQTLHRFLKRTDVLGIIVPHAADDQWLKAFPEMALAKVYAVQGGDERADSVLNGLHFLMSLPSYQAGQRVAVHDAARPCVSQKDLDKLFTLASEDEAGAILAVAATDTVKYSEHADARITQTLDRDHIAMAQTPQVFVADLLVKALLSAQVKGLTVTDEASAMELAGYHPQLVFGSKSNLKITTADDLALAEFYLSRLLETE